MEFSATLKRPLTMEDLEKITDSELEGTTKLFIKTPKGKVVTFIKELERKPCEDCVSREELLYSIGAGEEMFPEDYDMTDVYHCIRNLPSVTPKSKWISVDEKLPEEGQNVLFCDIDNDIMLGYHVKGRPNTHFSQDGTYEDIKNVRSWMPLPEPPYKEEVEND